VPTLVRLDAARRGRSDHRGGHLGDTVETVSRVYAHWLRDDRDVPAAVLDRVLAPGTRNGRVMRRLMRGRDVLGRRSGRVCDGEPACKPDSSAPVANAELTLVVSLATRQSSSGSVSTRRVVAQAPEDWLRTGG
jgi:hypothetical protein